MAGVVVIFDFDKTIVDVDSDNWVVDELGATDLFNRLLPTMSWNSLMDRMMTELHLQGKSMHELVDTLKRIPIHPRIIPAIRSAHAMGCDLKIVSDANTFFIESILKHHGVRNLFSEILTNPSFIDSEGRLRILPYHEISSSFSHGCSNPCPPNMCKGLVIDEIRVSLSNKKMIYVGDGRGDYCAALKLGDGDAVLARKGFPLCDLIRGNPDRVKATVHEWCDGEEMERVLICLVNAISVDPTSSVHFLSGGDCKFFQSTSASTAGREEVVHSPVLLPVPQ